MEYRGFFWGGDVVFKVNYNPEEFWLFFCSNVFSPKTYIPRKVNRGATWNGSLHCTKLTLQWSVSFCVTSAGFGVKMLSTANMTSSQYIPMHGKQIRGLAFSSRSKGLLLSASLDSTIKLTRWVPCGEGGPWIAFCWVAWKWVSMLWPWLLGGGVAGVQGIVFSDPVSLNLKCIAFGVPLWLHGLRIPQRHCCVMGSIPDPGISAQHRHRQKEKKNVLL